MMSDAELKAKIADLEDENAGLREALSTEGKMLPWDLRKTVL